jgi:hypothetical protein
MLEKEMTDKPKNTLNSQQTPGIQPQNPNLIKKNSEPMQSFEETSSCNTFMEYFYVFGANEKIVAREDFYLNSRFAKPGYLKMQLLSKFPPFEKPNSNVDESVIMSHCFPNGFNLLSM